MFSRDEDEEDEDDSHLMIPRLWDIPLLTKSKRLISNAKLSSFNEEKKSAESMLLPQIEKQNSTFGSVSRNKPDLNQSMMNGYLFLIKEIWLICLTKTEHASPLINCNY